MLELFYVLFLESGYIKSLMKAFQISIPIDITLAFAIIVIILFFFKKKNILSYSKKNLNIIYYILLFTIWMLFSSFYTSSDSYWEHKFIYFFTTLMAIIIPLLLDKKFNVNKGFIYLVMLTTFLNIIFVSMILPYIYINELFHEVSGTYLATAVTSGLNILLIMVYKIFKNKYLSNILLLVNLLTLVGSGGRGGLVFTVLVLLIYIISTNVKKILRAKISKKLFKYIALFILIIFGISTYYQLHKNEKENNIIVRSINRLVLIDNLLTHKDAGSSVNTRIEYIDFSINKIFDTPRNFIFGYGIGSFGIEYNKIDKREYPHNLILEIWFEMGLIGVLLFTYFLFSIFKSTNINPSIWIVIYMFLNVMKSSNLVDIRLFMAILAFYVIVGKNSTVPRREINVEK